MSGDERTLMPEVLPAPGSEPVRGGPRRRALARLNRMRNLAVAATTLSATCGFGCVDEAPKPGETSDTAYGGPGCTDVVDTSAFWTASGSISLLADTCTRIVSATLVSGTATDTTIRGRTLNMQITPDAGATVLYITINVETDAYVSSPVITLQLDLSAGVQPLHEIPVTVAGS